MRLGLQWPPRNNYDTDGPNRTPFAGLTETAAQVYTLWLQQLLRLPLTQAAPFAETIRYLIASHPALKEEADAMQDLVGFWGDVESNFTNDGRPYLGIEGLIWDQVLFADAPLEEPCVPSMLHAVADLLYFGVYEKGAEQEEGNWYGAFRGLATAIERLQSSPILKWLEKHGQSGPWNVDNYARIVAAGRKNQEQPITAQAA